MLLNNLKVDREQGNKSGNFNETIKRELGNQTPGRNKNRGFFRWENMQCFKQELSVPRRATDRSTI